VDSVFATAVQLGDITTIHSSTPYR